MVRSIREAGRGGRKFLCGFLYMSNLMQAVISGVVDKASWTERAKSLERLATLFADGALAPAERQSAIDAFRVVIYDGEPLVRLVLAETVKSSLDLPRDILLSLARDVAKVATPVLEHSPLLGEEDLLPIVQRGRTAHRLAIAGRRQVTGRVAAALCRAGERSVILRLLDNLGAALSEQTLHLLLDRFPDEPAFAAAIARRRLLPVSVGSRLFGKREALAPHLVWNRTGSLG